MLEWQKTFEEKLAPLLSVRESLSEEEAQKMGRKDPEQEVEKFVTSNTQELGKDKWLCPLSGKKFKVWDVRDLCARPVGGGGGARKPPQAWGRIGSVELVGWEVDYPSRMLAVFSPFPLYQGP